MPPKIKRRAGAAFAESLARGEPNREQDRADVLRRATRIRERVADQRLSRDTGDERVLTPGRLGSSVRRRTERPCPPLSLHVIRRTAHTRSGESRAESSRPPRRHGRPRPVEGPGGGSPRVARARSASTTAAARLYAHRRLELPAGADRRGRSRDARRRRRDAGAVPRTTARRSCRAAAAPASPGSAATSPSSSTSRSTCTGILELDPDAQLARVAAGLRARRPARRRREAPPDLRPRSRRRTTTARSAG